MLSSRGTTFRKSRWYLSKKYKRHRKEEGKADATVNHELTFLRHFFNKCIDFRLAESNPFRVVKKTTNGDYRVEKIELFKEQGRTRYLGRRRRPSAF